MSIQITISGDTAIDIAQLVQDLAGTMNQANASANVSTAPKKDKPKTRQTEKPTPERDPVKDAEPVQDEDQEVDSDPVEETDADDSVPIPTVVELRAKAQEVGSDASKKPKIKALLNAFGVPNITSVPENQRATFMKRLEAL